MKNYRFKLFCLVLAGLVFVDMSCKKDNQEFGKLNSTEQEQLEIHNQKVSAWMRMFQVNEQIKANTLKVFRTTYSKKQFITRLQVGELGSSLYFISEKNYFNTYGINSEIQNGKSNGIVEIFDFQKMEKRGLKFNSGRLVSILTFPKEQHFNNNSLST